MSDMSYMRKSYEEWPEQLTPGEVAILFRVNTKTVSRWANSGLLAVTRTPGGRNRFEKREVYKAWKGHYPEGSDA